MAPCGQPVVTLGLKRCQRPEQDVVSEKFAPHAQALTKQQLEWKTDFCGELTGASEYSTISHSSRRANFSGSS